MKAQTKSINLRANSNRAHRSKKKPRVYVKKSNNSKRIILKIDKIEDIYLSDNITNIIKEKIDKYVILKFLEKKITNENLDTLFNLKNEQQFLASYYLFKKKTQDLKALKKSYIKKLRKIVESDKD